MSYSTIKRNAVTLMMILGTTGFAFAHTTTMRPTTFGSTPVMHAVSPVAASGSQASRTQQTPPPAHPRNNIPL